MALPSGFVDEVAWAGLSEPTQIEFASDGRVFVAEKSGVVKVFDGMTDTSAAVFADLRPKVHNFWDRGLLGLELHPDFPATPAVYVLYTHDAAIGGTAPRWGTPSGSGDGCPNPPGATEDGCVVSGRLSRLTAGGGTSTGETVLIEDWCQQYPSHSIGDMAFGPDGALYVSGGDGASFNFVDYGQDGNPLNPCGDPPVPVGGVQQPPSAEGGALRSQDLRTPGDPVTLDGTVIRIDPTTGAGMAGNPLSGSADLNARRVIAQGLRNPFRIAFRPGTSELWVGDVGWSTWEEVNRITDTTPPSVVNFGWPCYEGMGRQDGYDGANLTTCETLYSSGQAAAPFFTYRHDLDVAPPDDCPPAAPPAPVSSSITGLAFYEGAAFPQPFHHALFGADYSRNCIWVMYADANGLAQPSTVQAFQPTASNPVAIEMGPDGALYYVDLTGGAIRRIRYTANLPPSAVATASPSAGPAPLAVTFDGRASTDPEGMPLTYVWDLDGDGQFDDATGETAAATYATQGQHTARLRVTDPQGAVGSAAATVQVDNDFPAIEVTSPDASLAWAVGDRVTFAASATDPQDGDISARLDWDLALHHCSGSTCHKHPLTSWEDTPSGSFDAPDHEYPSYLELTASVADSSGALTTYTRRIDPRTVELTISSDPSGLLVVFGSSPAAATPFTRTVIVNSVNSLAAPSPQILASATYNFVSWSDGGARSHEIRAPSVPTTYVAQFAQQAPGCADTLPAVTTTSWQRNGTASVVGSAVQLTPATSAAAGSVIYGQPISSAGLHVCFSAEIGGGTGADGMTLMLLDPTAGTAALGAGGSGLGYGGLTGRAVALDTYDSGAADPSDNFVGIASGGTADALTWLATSTAVSALENAGPIPIEVQAVAGRLVVTVAGSQVLDTAVQLPEQVLIGFSAGTGGLNNRHLVSNVRVETSSPPPPQPGFITIAPTSVSFGSVTIGSSATSNVVISNTGGTDVTLSAVTMPTAPFAAGTPAIAAGTVIPAGGSVTQALRFSPTATGTFSGTLRLTPNTTQGTITVPLSGSGVATAGRLVLTPSTLNFSSIRVGSSATLSFVLSNTGGSPVTITSVQLPGAPFRALQPAIAAGMVIQAGQSVTQVVEFAPTRTGNYKGMVSVGAGSSQPALTVNLQGRATR